MAMMYIGDISALDVGFRESFSGHKGLRAMPQ